MGGQVVGGDFTKLEERNISNSNKLMSDQGEGLAPIWVCKKKRPRRQSPVTYSRPGKVKPEASAWVTRANQVPNTNKGRTGQ